MTTFLAVMGLIFCILIGAVFLCVALTAALFYFCDSRPVDPPCLTR